MSSYIKRQIDGVEDNIYLLERERDELHYEVYVCHRERWLLQYKLTLRELDNQYDELQRLEKKYNIELRKERYKRSDEQLKRTLKTLTSQVERLVHLENEKKVKGNEIVMEIEHHVEEAATEDPVEEVKKVTEDPVEEVKQVEGTKVASEETMQQLDCFQNVEDRKVVDDIIEVEHIDFIIPEYLPTPPSLAHQFPEFFAPQPLSIQFILVPSHLCVVLDFYKTRGRVFSNKGRMMRNGNKELKYMFIISLCLSSVEINDVLIFMFYMWG